jgi:hypothetical protein
LQGKNEENRNPTLRKRQKKYITQMLEFIVFGFIFKQNKFGVVGNA